MCMLSYKLKVTKYERWYEAFRDIVRLYKGWPVKSKTSSPTRYNAKLHPEANMLQQSLTHLLAFVFMFTGLSKNYLHTGTNYCTICFHSSGTQKYINSKAYFSQSSVVKVGDQNLNITATQSNRQPKRANNSQVMQSSPVWRHLCRTSRIWGCGMILNSTVHIRCTTAVTKRLRLTINISSQEDGLARSRGDQCAVTNHMNVCVWAWQEEKFNSEKTHAVQRSRHRGWHSSLAKEKAEQERQRTQRCSGRQQKSSGLQSVRQQGWLVFLAMQPYWSVSRLWRTCQAMQCLQGV